MQSFQSSRYKAIKVWFIENLEHKKAENYVECVKMTQIIEMSYGLSHISCPNSPPNTCSYKKKSKAMIFNFTNNFQFTIRLEMEGENIEIIKETKLLGVMINDKLNWDSNTQFLVKRANARMRLLHQLVEFSVPLEDLLNIYILYVRSILEQSCQVWHSSLTLDNFKNLERVETNALRIILQEDYSSYSHALNMTGLSTLFERREQLCLKFAKSSFENKDMNDIFLPNEVISHIETRYRDMSKVKKSRTKRDYKIPQFLICKDS